VDAGLEPERGRAGVDIEDPTLSVGCRRVNVFDIMPQITTVSPVLPQLENQTEIPNDNCTVLLISKSNHSPMNPHMAS
jgi:hypothetical protein